MAGRCHYIGVAGRLQRSLNADIRFALVVDHFYFVLIFVIWVLVLLLNRQFERISTAQTHRRISAGQRANEGQFNCFLVTSTPTSSVTSGVTGTATPTDIGDGTLALQLSGSTASSDMEAYINTGDSVGTIPVDHALTFKFKLASGAPASSLSAIIQAGSLSDVIPVSFNGKVIRT